MKLILTLINFRENIFIFQVHRRLRLLNINLIIGIVLAHALILLIVRYSLFTFFLQLRIFIVNDKLSALLNANVTLSSIVLVFGTLILIQIMIFRDYLRFFKGFEFLIECLVRWINVCVVVLTFPHVTFVWYDFF